MKKSFLLLALTAIAVGFTSCDDNNVPDEKNVLVTPSPEVSNVTSNSATIRWTAVPNATQYIYTYNGSSELTTTNASITLNGLTPETNYTFTVKATRLNSEYYLDSQVAVVQFTTLAASGGEEPDQPEQPDQPGDDTKHIVMFQDKYDTFNYVWDNGKLVEINRPDGRMWTFTYSGNTVTVDCNDNDDYDYTVTLNADGMAESVVDYKAITWNYTYKDGFLRNVTNTSGLDTWYTYNELPGGAGTNGFYWESSAKDWAKWTAWWGTEENTYGIQYEYKDMYKWIGVRFWFVVTGWFGKAAPYLVDEFTYDTDVIYPVVYTPLDGGITATYGDSGRYYNYVYE